MTEAEQNFYQHLSECSICAGAHKYVNAFCARGRFLFLEWSPAPVRVTVLSEEQSRLIVAEAFKQQRKAGLN